jgi:hypothetical protein
MNRLRAGTFPALVAGAISLAIGFYYVALIASQGSGPGYCSLCEPGVWFIAGIMFGGGILACASALMPSGRTYALAAAAGMLTFIALLVVLSSIGLIAGPPMLLAAGLTSVAAARAARREGTSKATAFAVALLLLLLGIGGEFATIAMGR